MNPVDSRKLFQGQNQYQNNRYLHIKGIPGNNALWTLRSIWSSKSYLCNTVKKPKIVYFNLIFYSSWTIIKNQLLFNAEVKQYKTDVGTLPRKQKKMKKEWCPKRLPILSQHSQGYLKSLPILSQLHQPNVLAGHSLLYKSPRIQAMNHLSVWVGSHLQLRVEMLQKFLIIKINII